MNNLSPLKFDRRRTRVKHCPCGKNNRDGKFAPFVGHNDKGYCHSCGKTFPPGTENTSHPSQGWNLPPQPVVRTSYISPDILKKSLARYNANNFIKYLCTVFGDSIAMHLARQYFVGTSKKWNGANVFWQVDAEGKIRSGKIMLYDAITGKRSQEERHHARWAHTELKPRDFNFLQCFFGEHLLRDMTLAHKRVAIVESEKTALIASVYLPQFLWMACGGKNGLHPSKCKALQNRKVVLFPDTDAFADWKLEAQQQNFELSDYFEKLVPEDCAAKLDIADYLLKMDRGKF